MRPTGGKDLPFRPKEWARAAEETARTPMPILSNLRVDGTLVLRVVGRFDYRAREQFLESYEHCDSEPCGFEVDLRDAEYLDSSALGLLLTLRDFAAAKGARVTLCNARPLVARTLAAAEFGQWFTVA